MIRVSVDESQMLGNLMLNAGTALIKAGAGTSRIVSNLGRIAAAYEFESHVEISTRNLSVSLHRDQSVCFSGSRSLPTLPGVNFKVITSVSELSWKVTEEIPTLTVLEKEVSEIINIPGYPRLIVLILVGLAGASFCYIFGGSIVEMMISFVATFCGLFLRQEMNRKRFNPFLVTYCSAVFASLVIGIFYEIKLGTTLDHAFATSVLFLVPGVPLINAAIDMMDGYILNGIDRGINGMMHAFGIGAGLATVIYIFNVQ